MKTDFSLWEILDRENPAFITGMGLQCVAVEKKIIRNVEQGHFLIWFQSITDTIFVSLFIKKLAWFDRELFLLLALCHKQELYIEPDLCDLTVMHLDLVAEIGIAGWSLEKKGTKVKFCLTLFAVFKTWNFPDAIYFFDHECTLAVLYQESSIIIKLWWSS